MVNYSHGNLHRNMKAQYVYENVRFERGMDPKRGLDIGLRREIEKNLQKLGRDHDDIKYVGFTNYKTPFGIGLPRDRENSIWFYIAYQDGDHRKRFEDDIEWIKPYSDFWQYTLISREVADHGYVRIAEEYEDLFTPYINNPANILNPI
jgi:hypothetical protein